MKKYTLKDNVISALIGIAIGIPLALYGIHSQDTKEVETVKADYNLITTIRETPSIQVEPETTVQMVPVKIDLGTFKTTAYCDCVECCGKSDGITKSGVKTQEGRTIAVDPDVIPLGSVVEIDGVEYIAEDIGGAIKGDRIDIYFDNHDRALEYGVQYREVYMIEEADKEED